MKELEKIALDLAEIDPLLAYELDDVIHTAKSYSYNYSPATLAKWRSKLWKKTKNVAKSVNQGVGNAVNKTVDKAVDTLAFHGSPERQKKVMHNKINQVSKKLRGKPVSRKTTDKIFDALQGVGNLTKGNSK